MNPLFKTEVINNASFSDFEAHKTALSEKSEAVFENSIGDNFFLTLKGGKEAVHTYFSKGRGEIRTVTFPISAYSKLPTEDNPTDAPVGDLSTELIQIDLDNRRVDCGMSYVFRLSDGRFFIIDGGYFTHGECDRLYRLLRSYTPEGKLHIAGWFFSHAHQDHMGAFLDFISKYTPESEIEGLYYNFPSLSLPESVRWKGSDNSTMREFEYTVCHYLPNVKRHYLHTGEMFSIAGVKFSVLFTHEDIYPERIGSFNDTSTVLMVSYSGQKLLFLGDLQESSCRKLEAMYKDNLKSDLVQVAHHGFNGSTVETYDFVSPAVVLWPTADYGYYGNAERKVNAHLIEMPCAKEHIIAGINGTVSLILPYIPSTSKKIDLPK